MPRGAVVPAIQHDDGFTVGHVVFVRIGNEQQVRRVQNPDSAVADLDARETSALIPEHRAFVEAAVTVDIFQNDNTVTHARIEVGGRFGVCVVLGNP